MISLWCMCLKKISMLGWFLIIACLKSHGGDIVGKKLIFCFVILPIYIYWQWIRFCSMSKVNMVTCCSSSSSNSSNNSLNNTKGGIRSEVNWCWIKCRWRWPRRVSIRFWTADRRLRRRLRRLWRLQSERPRLKIAVTVRATRAAVTTTVNRRRRASSRSGTGRVSRRHSWTISNAVSPKHTTQIFSCAKRSQWESASPNHAFRYFLCYIRFPFHQC